MDPNMDNIINGLEGFGVRNWKRKKAKNRQEWSPGVKESNKA